MKHYFSNELVFILLALSVWMFLPIGFELYHRSQHPSDLIDEVSVIALDSLTKAHAQIKKSKFSYTKVLSKTTKRLNLNTCDTVALKQIKGIGSILANRIVKFRTYLKGYVRVEQLNEVYGFSKENYERLKDCFYVEKNTLRVISKDTLLAKPYHYNHPYLTKELKRMIYNKSKNKSFTIDSLNVFLRHHSGLSLNAYCY
jgi:ribosomal protein S13